MIYANIFDKKIKKSLTQIKKSLTRVKSSII